VLQRMPRIFDNAVGTVKLHAATSEISRAFRARQQPADFFCGVPALAPAAGCVVWSTETHPCPRLSASQGRSIPTIAPVTWSILTLREANLGQIARLSVPLQGGPQTVDSLFGVSRQPRRRRAQVSKAGVSPARCGPATWRRDKTVFAL
jgi:hypothetical protein